MLGALQVSGIWDRLPEVITDDLAVADKRMRPGHLSAEDRLHLVEARDGAPAGSLARRS